MPAERPCVEVARVAAACQGIPPGTLRRIAARTRWALLAGTLLAACSPAALPAPEPPAPAADRFVELDPSAITTLAELLRMEDTRRFDAARATRHAAHALPFVRSRVALAGGRSGDRAATPLLLQLLDDDDDDVRASAVFALGLLADSTDHVVAALAAIARDSLGGSAAVEAVAALGRIGTPAAFSAVDRVIALATDSAGTGSGATGRGAPSPPPRVPPERVAEALLTIWKFPRTRAAVDRIVPLTLAADSAIRWRATYALMRWSDPRSAEALKHRLSDDDPLTRALAARALRAPLADSAGVRAGAREGLQLALADSHPHVRINAVRALGTYGEPALVPPIAALLADPDSNVVLATIEALVTMEALARVPLRQVANDARARATVRAAALGPLFGIAPDDALAAALRMAAADDRLARLYAARALTAARWEDVADALRELSRDPDPFVAAAAFTTTGSLAPPGTGRPLFTEGMTAAHPAVRAAAIRALQRSATVVDLPLVLEAYDAAQHDAHNTAALAAVDALAALAARGVPVERSFFLRFRPPADPAVRRRIAQRLGATDRAGWESVETPRPLGWYEERVRRQVAPVLAGGEPPRVAIDGPTGTIELELDPVAAPLTVDNFLALASQGYFDAREARAPRWHRVVPNFVLQDGDPRGDGSGPGYSIRDELNRLRYGRGTLGMALAGPDTGGSQFFITHAPQPHLDGGYTIFGRVTGGMDAADRIVQDDPLFAIRVLRD